MRGRTFPHEMASTCPPLRIAERTAARLAGDSSFWELYGASFERRLREPAAALLEGVRQQKVLALAAADDERVVGLAAIHLLREPAISLLLYLAVSQELRGQRIGSTLLEHAVLLAARRQREQGRAPRGWAVQVELPELSPTSLQREQRRKQILFFRKHGARPLPCSWVRPPVRGGPPGAARLLHAPAGGLPLRRDEVRALARAIYFEKYAETNGVDPRLLASLLAPAPAGAPGAVMPAGSWQATPGAAEGEPA